VEQVKPLIEGLRIGKVARVDRVMREDGRGKHYQVFIHFDFWDTDNPESCRLRAQISRGETAKLEYERPWFWTLVLNTKVRPPHEDPYNYFPSVSFAAPRPPPPPMPFPMAPMLPIAPAFHQPFPQPLPIAPGFPAFPLAPAFPQHPQQNKMMIPRTLRMAAIGHHEKRRPRKREVPPPQLVAFKNPPAPEPEPVVEEAVEDLIDQLAAVSLAEDTNSDVSELTTEEFPQKGYYNDTDAPKAEVVVPEYGNPEEIQMAVARISKKKGVKGAKAAKAAKASGK